MSFSIDGSYILGNQPRAVKKRTPRFPVSYSQKKDDRDDYIPLNKKDRRSAVDANDDEVAHVAALALTEASQRGGSPQVSQSPHKKTEHGKSSPVQTWDKMVFDCLFILVVFFFMLIVSFYSKINVCVFCTCE